jgi:predicted nucleic acid-binding protein
LRAAGNPITTRALDLLIAAIAITHDLTPVTRNTKDYEYVHGLLLYGR